MSGYVKTFKIQDDKLMSSGMSDEKLLDENKTIWNKIKDLKKY